MCDLGHEKTIDLRFEVAPPQGGSAARHAVVAWLSSNSSATQWLPSTPSEAPSFSVLPVAVVVNGDGAVVGPLYARNWSHVARYPINGPNV